LEFLGTNKLKQLWSSTLKKQDPQKNVQFKVHIFLWYKLVRMGGEACSSTNAGVLRSKARIQKKSLCCKKTGRRGKHRDTERERERDQ
jgi:hypothetical protein